MESPVLSCVLYSGDGNIREAKACPERLCGGAGQQLGPPGKALGDAERSKGSQQQPGSMEGSASAGEEDSGGGESAALPLQVPSGFSSSLCFTSPGAGDKAPQQDPGAASSCSRLVKSQREINNARPSLRQEEATLPGRRLALTVPQAGAQPWSPQQLVSEEPDLVIEVSRRWIRAHKSLLAAKSPDILRVKGVSYGALRLLIDTAGMGEVHHDNLAEVVSGARVLQMPCALHCVAEAMRAQLRLHNC